MKSITQPLSVAGLIFLSIYHATAKPNLPSSFDESLYKPMDLAGYCSEKYDGNVVIDGTHAFHWQCEKDGQYYGISAADVCLQQYGSDYSYVLLGAHKYDWACVDWSELADHVVPIVVIASNYFWNNARVDMAIKRAAKALERVREWYENAMYSGKTFKVHRPIVQLSLISRREWHDLSCRTADPADRPSNLCNDLTSPGDRYGYLWKAIEEAQKTTLDVYEHHVIAPIFVFTGGANHDYGLGAAASGLYNAQPPSVAACSPADTWCGVYALGHEIGHNFGLDHTCERDGPPVANCGDSIMQAPNIREAILVDVEQQFLDDSEFFFN